MSLQNELIRPNRRHFLKGAGVLMAVPMFESFPRPPRSPANRELRGKRFICLSNNYGVYPQAFFPEKGGRDFELPSTLQPLAAHRGDFTVFSNLDHGLQGGHACVPSLLSGVMPTVAGNYPEMNLSLDQKLAEAVGAATRYPSLTLQVNEANLISFTRTGVQVPALDVRRTFRALFLEENPAEKTELRKTIARHGSILDLVREEARGVERTLNPGDRTKFAEYLEAVRSLERKLDLEAPWLDRPKPKAELAEPNTGKGTPEELKAMVDLIVLAIQTDSSRIFTLTSGFANGDFGLSGSYHGFSHHGERPAEVNALKAIEGYQISMLAYLIERLKAIPDPLNAADSLFDQTVLLYGCGMATGQHTTKNLPLLLAGGGFKLGEHRVLPEGRVERIPAANLLLSILQSFGLEVERFGTSTGTMQGLE